MLWNIVRYTPVWVWGLLAALLALGVSQLRRREVSRARLLVLPAVLVTLGLWSTSTTFAAPLPALMAWALAVGSGVLLGRRLPTPAGAAWDAARQRLQLPGSMLPLAVIVIVFSLRYVGSIALALHPAWREDLGVTLPMAAAYGLISGMLLGRVLALRALAGRSGATIAVDVSAA